MGVEVVHLFSFSVAFTPAPGACRTNSAASPDLALAAEDSRLLLGRRHSDASLHASGGARAGLQGGCFGVASGEECAGRGGVLEFARASFWGEREQLRANPGGRLARQPSGCACARLYDDFGREGGPDEDAGAGNSCFSKGQVEDRPALESSGGGEPSGTSNGDSDSPRLGDRTFRLMSRRLAAACSSGLDGDGGQAAFGARGGREKKNKIKEQVAGGVQIPSSLRDLKRKARARTVEGGLEGVVGLGAGLVGDSVATCCALKNAFASMVFMMRALQSYSVYMREVLFAHADADTEELAALVAKEMHGSVLWLFDRVYSCSPKLMVSLMILLANFTVFSMGSNVARAALVEESTVSMTPTLVDHRLGLGEHDMLPFKDSGSSPQAQSDSVPYPFSGPSLRNCAASDLTGSYHSSSRFGSGGGHSRIVPVAGSHGGDSGNGGSFHHRPGLHQDEPSAGRFVGSSGAEHLNMLAASEWLVEDEEEAGKAGVTLAVSTSEATVSSTSQLAKPEPSLKELLEETVKELELRSGEPYHHVYLDQETIRRLVAPVTVKMERDDYICFDRTDLEYQHAIGAEPSNPLLLANYAQFLYVVRHKNDSAEALFHRALEADPADGEVIGRYASFLWLARGDCAGAERAYKAAIALEPSNPYHAGSYAHFLWHSEEDSACIMSPMT